MQGQGAAYVLSHSRGVWHLTFTFSLTRWAIVTGRLKLKPNTYGRKIADPVAIELLSTRHLSPSDPSGSSNRLITLWILLNAWKSVIKHSFVSIAWYRCSPTSTWLCQWETGMWQGHTGDYRMGLGIRQHCDILHSCTEPAVSPDILWELGAQSFCCIMVMKSFPLANPCLFLRSTIV